MKLTPSAFVWLSRAPASDSVFVRDSRQLAPSSRATGAANVMLHRLQGLGAVEWTTDALGAKGYRRTAAGDALVAEWSKAHG